MNRNSGNWLKQLNGKTVDEIYQVDYNNNRHEDSYLPFLFFITFLDFDKYLEIEGDFDGGHIRINFYDNSGLDEKLKKNNFPDETDLWSVYQTESNEILGQLIGRNIDFLEYGIDKEEYEINGTICKGEKDVFNFIRFKSDTLILTIFEGGTTGLGVSDDPELKLYFEETFDKYDTK